MIRVLHVIDHLGLGGAQSAVLDLVRNMDANATQQEVAAMHGGGPFANALESAGIRVHSLSKNRWPPAYLKSLPDLLKKNAYDVLHFHLQGSNWLAKPLAAGLSPAIRIAHDHTSGDLRFRGLPSLLPEALTHFASHRIIAVSPGVRDFLCTWEGIPAEKISIVPNGIDTNIFQPATENEREIAREKFQIPPGVFVVGAMGRLAHEKNFALLPLLAEALPEIHFLIAGEGPERVALEAKIRTGNGNVRLVGRVDDRVGFYAALDAFVLPSLYEGLPMALLEAMAMGLPCVASHLPDISSALDSGRFGKLCDPSDPATFVDALTHIQTHSGHELGAAARAHCETRFSAKSAADAVLQIYRQELLFTEPLTRW
jgi:glycosyltransferase involved in cell wall biosynthesis